ncbi:TRAP transporter small permease [Chachezhania sediminis]|uniref:TRAP transporter small permease n=1 Tax=Chachezhania sediminis TaxID=2599291 RepID=UPI00131B0743|nr:TRAP transporter small permease subunit [Chachezhania sediminis]
MKQFSAFISTLSLAIGAFFLVSMVLLIVVDVAMRNLLGVGFPATAELVSRYAMVLVTFMPIAYAELQRRHIEVTAVTGYLPRRMQHVLFVAGIAISIPAYLLLAYGNGIEAIRNTESGSFVYAGELPLITWPSLWILPVSYAVMALALCVHLGAALRGTLVDTDRDTKTLEDLQDGGGVS